MSHLRVIKPRAEHTNHEQDLRGMGNEKIIQDHYPWIFLTTKGIDVSAMEDVLKIYSLTHKKGQHEGETHLFHKGKHNHKEKTLILFTAGMHILNMHHHTSMLLGQLDSLRQRTIALDHTDSTLKEELSEDYKNWKSKEHGIHLSENCHLYLIHADIHIPNNIVDLNFVNNILTSNSRQFIHLKGAA